MYNLIINPNGEENTKAQKLFDNLYYLKTPSTRMTPYDCSF